MYAPFQRRRPRSSSVGIYRGESASLEREREREAPLVVTPGKRPRSDRRQHGQPPPAIVTISIAAVRQLNSCLALQNEREYVTSWNHAAG